MERALLRNNHNVYVLGAGFSTLGGLPVVRTFMSYMRTALDGLESEGRSREADAIWKVLTFRRSAAAAAQRTNIDLDNIEDLFSLASAMGERGQYEDMKLAIAATLDWGQRTYHAHHGSYMVPTELCRESPLDRWPRRADVPSKAHERAPEAWRFDVNQVDAVVAALLGLLWPAQKDSENTFLSFNYDTLVEGALHKLGLGVGYGLSHAPNSSDQNAVKLLKLHGSLNWTADDDQVHVHHTYADVLARKAVPLIVPPTWQKEFHRDLTVVWSNAVDAIATATRLVILGFSMPRNDQHVRYLLAAGLKDNISLRDVVFVDLNAAVIQKRALTLLRPELVHRGVLRFHAEDIWTFLMSQPNRSGIGRGTAAYTAFTID